MQYFRIYFIHTSWLDTLFSPVYAPLASSAVCRRKLRSGKTNFNPEGNVEIRLNLSFGFLTDTCILINHNNLFYLTMLEKFLTRLSVYYNLWNGMW